MLTMGERPEGYEGKWPIEVGDKVILVAIPHAYGWLVTEAIAPDRYRHLGSMFTHIFFERRGLVWTGGTIGHDWEAIINMGPDWEVPDVKDT